MCQSQDPIHGSSQLSKLMRGRTVIAIAQPGFEGLEPGVASSIFVPITMMPVVFPDYDPGFRFFDPRLRWVNVYARLKPGITIAEAKASALCDARKPFSPCLM